MFESIQSIIAIATSAIVLLTTIYKICFKNEISRSAAYYNKVLVPFVIKYKKKSNIKPTKFLKSVVKRNNDNIPKYIFYLMEKEDDEKLKKVLIYDYFDIYNNDDNTMTRIMRGINRAIAYFLFFISFFALFESCYCMSIVVYTVLALGYQLISKEMNSLIIQTELKGNIFWMAVIAIILFGISLLCVVIAREINVDTYTLKEKKIKRLIERRVKTYDKKKEMFVL